MYGGQEGRALASGQARPDPQPGPVAVSETYRLDTSVCLRSSDQNDLVFSKFCKVL